MASAAHSGSTMSTKKLGARIKQSRAKRGLSQEALATKAKLHRVYLAKIEAGERLPSLPMLERIANVLRVSMAALVK
jgi:transcriptional regulator with XRE-family HTH domain